MTAIATPLLELTGIGKSFAGMSVLRDVNMNVAAGEIHALVGGNGAGKSTLIKCLSGYWRPDAGRIEINGQNYESGNRPIAFVQQDLGLVPTLSVAENVCLGLGFPTGPAMNVQWRALHEKVKALLVDLGHPDIDPRDEVRQLHPVQRTAVAIARAVLGLREGARILVLDEPTASLPAVEVGRLMETLARLRDSGIGMIYVSHHLAEIFELADRISVLRGGTIISTLRTSQTSVPNVVELMLGRKLETIRRVESRAETTLAPPRLRLEKLSGDRVTNVSLDVYPGEILGLAGLQGSGCTELAELVFGARRPTGGHIFFEGEAVEFLHPADAIGKGIALVTEDRHHDGCFLDHSVSENLSVTDLMRFFRYGWLSHKRERVESESLVQRFGVHPANSQMGFSALSGGNQQKAVLAKWLRLGPKLLICDQPDVGVDVGAKSAIYSTLREHAGNGVSVILISNQHDDLAQLCDRVAVLNGGRLAAVLSSRQVNELDISNSVMGLAAGEGAQ